MKNIQRIAAIAMAAVTTLTPATSFAANELVNSTSSEYVDQMQGYKKIGVDRTQEKVSEMTELADITDTTYSTTSQAEVYCTQGSTFSVIIPKVITLDGETKEGAYQVSVKGDITGNQKVRVEPDITLGDKSTSDTTKTYNFIMSEQNATVAQKDDITASIYGADDGGAKITWTQSEIKADTYDGTGTTIGKITAEDITAGSWKGTFDFVIELTNGGSLDVTTPPTEDELIEASTSRVREELLTPVSPAPTYIP